MINTENIEEPQDQEEPVDQPDENGGIFVQGFLRIHDPESGETIVQGRAWYEKRNSF